MRPEPPDQPAKLSTSGPAANGPAGTMDVGTGPEGPNLSAPVARGRTSLAVRPRFLRFEGRCRVRRSFLIALALTGSIGFAVLGYRWVDRTGLRQAHAAAGRDDWNDALRRVTAFLQTHPRDRQAQLLLARCRTRLGPMDEAERLYAAIPNLPPEAERLRADNLVRLQWWSPAAEVYEHLLARNPDDPYLLRQLAIVEFQAGRSAQAVQFSRRLARFPDQAAAANCMLGAIESNGGRADRAVEALHRALAINPTAQGLPISAGRIYSLLGRNLLSLDRAADARAVLEQAVSTSPDVDDFYLLGRALLRLREPEAATECWFRALELDPHSGPVLEALAQQALTAGRPEEAIGWLKLADRYSLPSTTGRYLLSRAYTRVGRPDLGRHYLDETARLQSNDERNALDAQVLVAAPDSPRAKLVRARRAAAEGNWKQAEIWVGELLEQHGDLPELRQLVDDIKAHRPAAALPGVGPQAPPR